MTKAQKIMLENYNRSNVRTLDEVYHNYSVNKACAYRDCESRRIELCGFDVRIPTHNQQVFTYAFRYWNEGKLFLHYETAYKIYDFCINGEV